MNRRSLTRVLLLLLLVGPTMACALSEWETETAPPPTTVPSTPSNPTTESPPVTTTDDLPFQTQARLNAAIVPVNDPVAMRTMLAPYSVSSSPTAPQQYQVGDRRTFDMDEGDAEAELIHITDHTYTWLVTGVQTDRATLIAAAEHFEDHIYPTVRQTFGSEWSPGIDNDVHLSILHYSDPGSDTAGFFSPTDELPRWVERLSNETEMFYVNIDGMPPGDDYYFAVLAHEFEHMIHWKTDRNEADWLDEGLAELACLLTGYDPGESNLTFIRNPDTQLNHWPYDEDTTAHYGSGYMFALYLWEHYGDTFIRNLAHQTADGLASLDIMLEEYETGLTAEDVFMDWVIANAINTGDYAYQNEEWKADLGVDATHDTYPASSESTVYPYATDYVELTGPGDLQISFRGDPLTPLLPVKAHTGDTFWWSNEGNRSDARLMHRFDLRGLSSATLRFWAWYDLEARYDYVYLSASADGGETWDLVQASTNDSRGDYGIAYNGESGEWIEEVADLSAYVGNEIIVRFDYATDDSINGVGFLVDDVSIPELGWSDYCDDEGEWEAEGFVLVGTKVPQTWAVQLIEFPPGETPHVRRMSLDELQTGQMELTLGEGVDWALLAISAIARHTTAPANYQYEITYR